MTVESFIERLFAQARDAGFSDCEAYYASGDQFEANVHQGSVIDYNVSTSIGLGFRGLLNGKMGYASTQALDDQAIELLVTGAKTNAALIEDEDQLILYPGDDEYPKMALYHSKLHALSASERLDMALALEKKALSLDPRVTESQQCGVVYVSGSRRIVNTRGLNVEFHDNGIGLYVDAIARDGDKVNTGFSLRFAREKDALHIDELAQKAVEEAALGLGAAPVKSGKYPVLLRRDAARSLLGAFTGIFSAEAAQKGLSLLNGREGEVIASDVITLIDDPHNPDGMSAAPFDGEGVATCRKSLIEGGRFMTLLHNLKTANKQGVKTTGNAARGSYASPIAVAPSNLYIEPGADGFSDLVKAAGSGLLITELNGLHAGANTVSGDFSLSAKGFVIENGAIARAVDQITLAGNFYQVLNDITRVGADLEFGFPGISCIGSPSLMISALSVAGN